MLETVTPRQHQDTNTNLFCPDELPSCHPLPCRYFRATRTPKEESLVCAISTTKGAVQFDPADYPGFLRCTWLRGGSALEKQPPCLRVGGSQEGLHCLLLLSATSCRSFSCICARRGSSSPSLEGSRVFPTVAVFEFRLQGNLHPVNLHAAGFESLM